jgi:hypothetical protein
MPFFTDAEEAGGRNRRPARPVMAGAGLPALTVLR